MASSLTFWSTILGFSMGMGYNLLEKVIQRSAETSINQVMATFEWSALIMILGIVILLSWVFYVIEKKESARADSDRQKDRREITTAINNLATEIKRLIEVKNERNNPDK